MLEFKAISKIYHIGDQEVKALNHVNLTIQKGKFTIILGPSGSGKSTLLNLLGGMDRASEGQFLFDDKDISQLNDDALSLYRKDVVGFVFQFYNLIPSLTALENVGIAANLTNKTANPEQYLQQVGLAARKNNFPSQLSGGEMQRVSIARALAKKPKLLLADEPTGALDSETGLHIIELLKDIAKNPETAVVMVTHNEEFARFADVVIRLRDGEISSVEENQ